jgi:sugar phosphate isomerase/epimerase
MNALSGMTPLLGAARGPEAVLDWAVTGLALMDWLVLGWAVINCIVMSSTTIAADLRLAPTLGPWAAATGQSPRDGIQAIANKGFTCIQLDAALAGVRPRDLDGRARRDLAACLRRCSLTPAGLDLFIPRSHFTDPRHADRAMAAMLAAITLAADLGRLPLSLAVPASDLSESDRATMVQAADAHGVRLVVHGEDQFDALLRWLNAVDLPCLRMGLDPAAALAVGLDPVAATQRHNAALGVGRLADWHQRTVPGDGRRCVTGEGELDLAAYRLSLELPTGRVGPVVLDLRDLPDPSAAATAGARAWRQAAPTMSSFDG